MHHSNQLSPLAMYGRNGRFDATTEAIMASDDANLRRALSSLQSGERRGVLARLMRGPLG